MTKYILFPLLSLRLLYADFTGGEISLGIFSHTPSGQASYTLPLTSGTTAADLEETLGWSNAQDLVFKGYIEHPAPFLPNVKLGYTQLSHDGTQNVTLFSWGDIIDFTGTLESALSINMTDITLYYELLDNWVEIDAGLTARYLSGDIDNTTRLQKAKVNFSLWVPMFYAKTRFNLPTTDDISLQAELNAISYSDITLYDYEISARYTFMMGLGLEAGYKVIHIDSDDLNSGLKSDMDFKGFYGAIVWDF